MPQTVERETIKIDRLDEASRAIHEYITGVMLQILSTCDALPLMVLTMKHRALMANIVTKVESEGSEKSEKEEIAEENASHEHES